MIRKQMFPWRDMYGNDPVRSLYIIPDLLSANAMKQKMLLFVLSSSLAM